MPNVCVLEAAHQPTSREEIHMRPRLVQAAALGAPLLLASQLLATPPAPVSPGSTEGDAVQGTCPTFSWTARAGATGYELRVYLADGDEPPVLEARLAEGASSWTPPLRECLEPDRSYAWAVRAVEASGDPAPWSEPVLFSIAAAPSEQEIARVLAHLERERAEDGGGARPETPQGEPPDASVGPSGTAPPPATPAPRGEPSVKAPKSHVAPGDLVISGSYRFKTPRLRFTWYPANAWTMAGNYTDYTRFSAGFGVGRVGNVFLTERLQLPQWATLRGLVCYYYDNQVNTLKCVTDANVRINRRTGHGTTKTELVRVTMNTCLTEPAPDIRSEANRTVAFPVVDNTFYQYTLDASWLTSDQVTNELRFYGCHLEYETPFAE